MFCPQWLTRSLVSISHQSLCSTKLPFGSKHTLPRAYLGRGALARACGCAKKHLPGKAKFSVKQVSFITKLKIREKHWHVNRYPRSHAYPSTAPTSTSKLLPAKSITHNGPSLPLYQSMQALSLTQKFLFALNGYLTSFCSLSSH